MVQYGGAGTGPANGRSDVVSAQTSFIRPHAVGEGPQRPAAWRAGAHLLTPGRGTHRIMKITDSRKIGQGLGHPRGKDWCQWSVASKCDRRRCGAAPSLWRSVEVLLLLQSPELRQEETCARHPDPCLLHSCPPLIGHADCGLRVLRHWMLSAEV